MDDFKNKYDSFCREYGVKAGVLYIIGLVICLTQMVTNGVLWLSKQHKEGESD